MTRLQLTQSDVISVILPSTYQNVLYTTYLMNALLLDESSVHAAEQREKYGEGDGEEVRTYHRLCEIHKL